MAASIQMILGLLIGGIGFSVIGDAPFAGFSGLFTSGFLLLTAIDRMVEMAHTKKKL